MFNMKQLIYIILVMLSFHSCKAQGIALGEYKNSTFDTQHILMLNADSTFSFFWKEGLVSDTAEGTWSVNRNKLTLNSFITKQDVQSFHEIVNCDTCKNESFVKVIDFTTKEEIPYSRLIIFDKGVVILDEVANIEGSAKVNFENIDSIQVENIGFNSYSFVPDKNNNSFYKVSMKPEELNRKVIDNETWKVKKVQLISPNGIILKK